MLCDKSEPAVEHGLRRRPFCPCIDPRLKCLWLLSRENIISHSEDDRRHYHEMQGFKDSFSCLWQVQPNHQLLDVCGSLSLYCACTFSGLQCIGNFSMDAVERGRAFCYSVLSFTSPWPVMCISFQKVGEAQGIESLDVLSLLYLGSASPSHPARWY